MWFRSLANLVPDLLAHCPQHAHVQCTHTHSLSLMHTHARTHTHTHLLDTVPPACTHAVYTHTHTLSLTLSPHRTQAAFCSSFPSAGFLGLQHSVWIAHLPEQLIRGPWEAHQNADSDSEGLEWGSGCCVSDSLPESVDTAAPRATHQAGRI